MNEAPKEKNTRLSTFYLGQQLILIGTFIFGWLLIAIPLSLSLEFQQYFDNMPGVKDIDPTRLLYIFSIPAFFLGYFLIAAVIQAREHFDEKWDALKISLVLTPTLYGISYVLTSWILFVIDKLTTLNPFDHAGLFLFIWTIGSLGGVSLETLKEVTHAYTTRKTSELERDYEKLKKKLEESGFKTNDETS